MTGVFFNGRQIITPTVESAVDDSRFAARNIGIGMRAAIVGRSVGGEPKTPIALRSPSHAKQILKGGELLKAVEKAFAPSNETNGPYEIYAVRVNPATQSSLTLKDDAAADVISLVSTDYGAHTTQIKVKIEAGTNKGKKLTSQYGDDYYFRDDVYRDAFTVQYSGAEATATMTVNNTQVILYAPAATPVATIALSDYDTVQKLVDRINVVTGFAATVVPGSPNTVTLNGLDAVTAQDVKTALYTETANLQAVIDWFNSAFEGYVTATRSPAGNKAPANIPLTYLAGGSDGTVANQDWADCYTALQTVDVQWLACLSSDEVHHAMQDAHCQYMSTAAKSERRGFVGGATGVALTAAGNAAFALNSDRTSYVWPGIYDYDEAGDLVLYPPYIAAAMLAGAFAGSPPGEPMTNKSLTIYGLERTLIEATETDQAIRAGVLAINKTSRGYRVVKSISTWLNDSRYNRVEVSSGAATDFVARAVRAALASLVGKKASPLLLGEATAITETTLRELARSEPVGPGVLVGNAASPAYRNIAVEIEGDILRVEFECSPVIPANYVLVTIHAVPFPTALRSNQQA